MSIEVDVLTAPRPDDRCSNSGSGSSSSCSRGSSRDSSRGSSREGSSSSSGGSSSSSSSSCSSSRAVAVVTSTITTSTVKNRNLPRHRTITLGMQITSPVRSADQQIIIYYSIGSLLPFPNPKPWNGRQRSFHVCCCTGSLSENHKRWRHGAYICDITFYSPG